MGSNINIPLCLYKYRSFCNLTLNMIVSDQIFFADPSTFNDPLDSRPTLEADLGAGELENLLTELFIKRVRAEMNAAAKAIKLRGEKTDNHISRVAHRRAERLISEIRYYATNPEYQIADPLNFLLGQYIEDELLRQYEKGIFSLAERANCPLMWSHYGDQHKGICIGYSVPTDAAENLYKVQYGGSRLVRASSILAMLAGDDMIRRNVDAAVLLRKAASWRYEREWRFIGPRGLRDSSLDLKEIVFGIRCDDAVKYAVIKALQDRSYPVSFFEMREIRGTFRLKKVAFDASELCSCFPRCNRSLFSMFDVLE